MPHAAAQSRLAQAQAQQYVIQAQQQQQFLVSSMMMAPPGLDPRLQGLLGHWQGRDGTRYHVTEDSPSSLTVATTRPNGQRRITRGLISTAIDALVRWGRRGQYYLEESGLPLNAVWCEARCLAVDTMPTKHVVFEWSRLEDGERNRPTRESSCPPARGFGRCSRSRSRSRGTSGR